MKSKYDRRNYIIIGLCAILVVMGVGYAAFSSLLTINGTANISNSWCVGFDRTKTNTYEVKKGISTGQVPTGTMTYSGTACETNYIPNASLTAVFHQPGDQITYTLTIKNKSSVTAVIKSILVDSESVSTNTTKKKGNITYIINMPADTTLSPNEETTMTVVAKVQNDTDITGTYTGGETQTINVGINTEQDDGNGGMDTTFTGTIYRNDTNGLDIGRNAAATYCAYGDMGGNRVNSCDIFSFGFNTKNECTTFIANNQDIVEQYQLTNITCENTPQLLSTNFKTDPSELNTNYYLKHDVVENVVTASYVCFVYNNQEHCLKGGDGGASFAANTQIIKDYQTFYNLPDKASDIHNTDRDSGCNFDYPNSYCDSGYFNHVIATSTGYTSVENSSYLESCSVTSEGNSFCSE